MGMVLPGKGRAAMGTLNPAILAQPTAAQHHENSVLASLLPSDWAMLRPHLYTFPVEKGAVLQHQEHPLKYVYFPHDGLVSLFATAPDGQTMEVISVGRGGAVCPAFKLNARESFLTAAAQVGMHLSRIETAHLQSVQQESTILNRALRVCRERLVLHLMQNLLCAGIHTVEQRLSRWLLETADQLETDVRFIWATQEEVAQRLGVFRTTVTLLAGRLQGIGAIRWRRSRVEILDRTRLETTACSCYADLRKRTRTLLPFDPPVCGNEHIPRGAQTS